VKENSGGRWSSDGVVSGGPGRVGADGDGADSILWLWLESGGNGTKHCQKRKRARLGSMGSKNDTA
jgi:hypothetical protein